MINAAQDVTVVTAMFRVSVSLRTSVFQNVLPIHFRMIKLKLKQSVEIINVFKVLLYIFMNIMTVLTPPVVLNGWIV